MVPGYGLKVLMFCSQNHFCLLVLHQAGKGISHSLFLDRWKKLLLTDVYALLYFIYLFVAVLLGEPAPLAEKQPPHVLSQDACPKQSDSGFIRENDLTLVPSSPVPGTYAEYHSVPVAFLGKKWLLC